MQIEKVKLADIREYETNAKLHPQSQIEQIKQSISDFGFNDPIAIDENNVIIEGHGRFKAVRQLGWTEVECIRLPHMDEQQKKAYILAHNKLTMNTDFDPDMLAMEIESILDFDMEDYGFDIPELDEPDELEKEPPEKESHREATYKQYNLDLLDLSRLDGFYDMPTLEPTQHIPQDLIGFNYMLTSKDKTSGIHCFVDDYQFERLWNDPYRYLEKVKEFDCFLTPDFSLYLDMPMAMKIWNVYRSRLIGQFMQSNGVTVIPTISWAEYDTFEFAFAGIEKGSVVAISTIGVKTNGTAMRVWRDGMEEMMKRLQPSAILVYGGKIPFDYGDTMVYYYDNKVTERMRTEVKHGLSDEQNTD